MWKQRSRAGWKSGQYNSHGTTVSYYRGGQIAPRWNPTLQTHTQISPPRTLVSLLPALRPHQVRRALPTHVHWHKPHSKCVLASPETNRERESHCQKSCEESCFIPSQVSQRKQRTGLGCQFRAARRCARPGHAPTCTARSYPISCVNMLTHPHGQHSPRQELKEKFSSDQTKQLSKMPERDTKEREKPDITHESFCSFKLKEFEQDPFS